MSRDAGEHPAAKKNLDTIMRSLQRPEAPGMRRALLNDTKTVQLMSPGGLYLGQALAFDVQLTRMFRVVRRITMGLFFDETERRLKPEYDVAVWSNDTLQDEDPAILAEYHRTIFAPLAAIPAKVIGDNVFAYRCAIMADDPDVSVWALTFYGSVPFLAITGTKDDPRQSRDECFA